MMLRALTLLSFVAAAAFLALAAQVPLSSISHGQAEHQSTILREGDISQWSLNRPPNTNTTDHLVFETVHSLLQRWPNTRMRSGHNIVPGSIPIGTLLYYGTQSKEVPSGPEWVSMDPEHSYLFCQNILDRQSEHGCWHLTLATTRPLKVIYFDGNSAAKLPHGTLDTQDLLIWGKLGSISLSTDSRRIQDLCEWGKNFGVDGFVRMEMAFEVMLCDFTSGVRVVSFANIVSEEGIQLMITPFASFEIIVAGSWHNHFPGETRVQLDLPGLVSFYDTELAPSLIDIRVGQERWDHRAGNVSSEDLLVVKSRLEAALTRSDGLSSGVDWKTLIQVIVNRYAKQLELARHILNLSATDPDDIIDLANKTQTQLRTMLIPYLLFAATPVDRSDKADLDWAIPIYKMCAKAHSHDMESGLLPMTFSEKLLLRAVRGTNREICRVMTKMWAAGVQAGIDILLNTKETVDIAKIAHLRTIWADDLDRLMMWLDWSVWVKCNPECGAEELCYLPTWPVGFPWGPQPPPRHPEELARPRPKCVSRNNPTQIVQ